MTRRRRNSDADTRGATAGGDAAMLTCLSACSLTRFEARWSRSNSLRGRYATNRLLKPAEAFETVSMELGDLVLG
jgi:hypothetical protein